jgi:hypothetical protein
MFDRKQWYLNHPKYDEKYYQKHKKEIQEKATKHRNESKLYEEISSKLKKK